jgi:GTP cyclohydrolase-4
MEVQTQDERPSYEVYLTNVGVKNLKTFIKIGNGDRHFRFIADVEIVVDLQSHLKGVHMSRLVEPVTEILADEMLNEATGFNELTERVLKKVRERFTYKTSFIRLKFEFAHEVMTPVSNRRSIEVYPVEFFTICNGNTNPIHTLTVKASGNTACPHALAVADGKRTHVQRALAALSISGLGEDLPQIEEMISIIESSFSSPTFSVLKTVDEAWVVQKMYENPLFVEDVCRNLLAKADNTFPNKKINFEAEVISEESIHKHDVVARGTIKRFNFD